MDATPQKSIVVRDIVRAEMMDEINEEVGGREIIRLCQSLELIRKEDDGPTCRICGNTKYFGKLSQSPDGYTWRCNIKYKNSSKKWVWCTSKESIRSNTIFEHSHLSLSKVLLIINLWCSKMNLNQIANQCEVNKETPVEWAKKFRAVLLDRFIFSAPKIGGSGKTVEIDESKFGKRKYHRGRRVEGTWIFGGVERESKRAFMVPVKKRSAAYLLPIIQHFIEPGTTIISDCWKAYGGLENMGFTRLTVNHSYTFKDQDTGACTNRIEGLWRHAKEAVGNKSRRKHLMDGQISKYLFFNYCRKSNLDAFGELCKVAADYYATRNNEPTERAAEWFALKEHLDSMVLETDQILLRDDDNNLIGENVEDDGDSDDSDEELDAAEYDNPRDKDYKS